MAEVRIGLKPEPVGTRLVRLRDVPPRERLHAYSKLVRAGELRGDEAEALLEVVLDPGDRGARIAA